MNDISRFLWGFGFWQGYGMQEKTKSNPNHDPKDGRFTSGAGGHKPQQLGPRDDYTEHLRWTREFGQGFGVFDDDSLQEFSERSDQFLQEVAEAVRNYKEGDRIDWKVIPAARLKRIWLDYGKSGVVRDSKGLDNIAHLVRENIVKLWTANALCGHDTEDPDYMFERVGIDFPKQEEDQKTWDNLYDYFETPDGSGLVSDYGLPFMLPLYHKIGNAESDEDKLLLIDRCLNIVHQRSDLADLFVEGGTLTLSEVATQKGAKSNPHWQQQSRNEQGEWTTGGAVAPVRKPKGCLSPMPEDKILLVPQSSNVTKASDRKAAEELLGLDISDLHRLVENTLGPDSAYQHELCAFDVTVAPSGTTGKRNRIVIGYSIPNGPLDRTSLMLSVVMPTDKEEDKSVRPSVTLDYLSIPDSLQKSGAGKRVLGMVMDLADHVDADRLLLLANIDMGGYCWARYGFLPGEKETWDGVRSFIRRSMGKVTGFPQMTNKEIEQLQDTIKEYTEEGTSPENIRVLAAMRHPCYHSRYGDSILGKALLRGSHWRGIAKLDDPTTLGILTETAGRK